ncbi:primosomal protein N' [Tomitella biformata]|uniref:primosomal protein N' n=1 Tax=Tomitella biformata TaxID=630403 RepID=UPI0004676E9A|nr:primosomal protein N' [Tomitella biformata]
MTATVKPADALPVARVLPVVQPAHLDRVFDYLVPADMDATAQVGVRVRVRFSGRLVDGYILDRVERSEHVGKLGFLERVISPIQVLTPELAVLCEAVAARYAGTRADVLRMAIPPRHARAEAAVLAGEKQPSATAAVGIDPAGWERYVHGGAYLAALAEGRGARAVWQALPGDDWPARLAEAAATCVTAGRSAVVVVPDRRDMDRVVAAATALVGAAAVVALSAGLGPAARYRRWLLAHSGGPAIVVGPRSTAFVPVQDLGLIAVWDDGDDNLAEPRSPYPHAREVALLRAQHGSSALLVGGHARTAEAQALVENGWAHDLIASREVLRQSAPLIKALADSDEALARDPGARSARLPGIAFEAARGALAADLPVLVQVPRGGYVPAVGCAKCREPARCRRCAGPLGLPMPGVGGGPNSPAQMGEDGAAAPTCRWCGNAERAHRCGKCGSRALRARVTGAGRTAEEFGRAFRGVPIISSSGEDVRDAVPGVASVVVATVGAEPVAAGGYGAALLLDGWALLSRADLRAGEETLRRWMAAAALVRPGPDGGRVVVVAEAGIPVVQALIRWDPVGHAHTELESRREVGFPPAVHVAAVDGSPDALAGFLEVLHLPAGCEVLGPVPMPAGMRGPAGSDSEPADAERVILRVRRRDGAALSAALREGLAQRSARRLPGAIRVQVDPIRVG